MPGSHPLESLDAWMPGSHPLESFGTAGGHLDPVRRRRERMAHLPPDQGRVIVDQQQVGHASLLPLGAIRRNQVIVASMAWFVQAATARGAAAGSTDFRPFRIEDDGAGTPFAVEGSKD
jgi:hypothetical protein